MTNHQHISSFDSRLTLDLTPQFKNNAFTPRTKLIGYKSHCTPSFFWQHRRLTPSYMHTPRPVAGNTIPEAHANQFPQILGFPEISDVKFGIVGWRLMESITDFFGWSDPIRWGAEAQLLVPPEDGITNGFWMGNRKEHGKTICMEDESRKWIKWFHLVASRWVNSTLITRVV